MNATMKLGQWMAANRWSSRALSEAWGIPEVTLKSWVHGRRTPRPKMQERIDQLTGGGVTSADWGRDAQQQQQKGAKNGQ